MGSLTYEGTSIQFEDRVLTHIQIVIVQKFAKSESFLMSWRNGKSSGDGREAIWLAPTIPLRFKFLGGRVPSVDRDWLLKLGKSADGPTGLIIADEQGALIEAEQSMNVYPGQLD